MKSVLFSRFFILLPWILIVIIMLDVDTRREVEEVERVTETSASPKDA